MPTTDGYNGAYTGPEIDAGIARANQAITVENSGVASMSETLGSGPYTIEFTEEAGSGGGSLPDGSAGQILGYVEDNVVGPIMSKSDLLSDETAEIYNQLPLSWKIGTLGTTAVCEGAAYGNGLFVAISRANTIGAFVSTDGITWMHVAFPVTFDARAVAFGAGKFVITGASTNIVLYSENGQNWLQATMPYTGLFENLCYGNDKFVSFYLDSNTTRFVYSQDGITWTSGGTLSYIPLYALGYGNGKFIAFGTEPYYSTDGISWAKGTATGGGGNIKRAIAYGNGKFVAVGNSGQAAYSEDGISWSNQDALPTSDTYTVLTFGDGQFVTANKNAFAYSKDGITWAAGTLPASKTWTQIIYADDKFLAVSSSGTTIYSLQNRECKTPDDAFFNLAVSLGVYVDSTQNQEAETTLTLDMLADHEERLCMLELTAL
jgi:hypothetical protein